MPGYNTIARYLHWVVAGLIVLQFVLAELAENAEELGNPLQQLAVTANHKSVGMTVLMLALVRLVWRLTHSVPALPEATPRWQQQAAKAAHWLLYALIFLLPLTGWMMSSASAYSVSWFNVFTFPDLLSASPSLKDTFEEVHEALAKTLFVVALSHIAAAGWHHLWDKDKVLHGMSSVGSVTAGALAIVVGVALLRGGDTASDAEQIADEAAIPEVVEEPRQRTASALPPWEIDHAASSIVFSAEQAGAVFEGRFNRWDAQIHFDGDSLADSHANVSIELASVDTQDSDRDSTLASAEWFNNETATFQASRFKRIDPRAYQTVDATLVFGGQEVSSHGGTVDLAFTVERRQDTVTLIGDARLDRTDLGLGTGEWLDTTWVGQFVDVTVTVVADTRDDPD